MPVLVEDFALKMSLENLLQRRFVCEGEIERLNILFKFLWIMHLCQKVVDRRRDIMLVGKM